MKPKDENHVFRRGAWTDEPEAPLHLRADDAVGFETKSLHAGQTLKRNMGRFENTCGMIPNHCIHDFT